ncbi:MAG: response regulator [Ardenticatenaceae bacterium]|nr:response regulator [Ardenticatenaceae bacterium]
MTVSRPILLVEDNQMDLDLTLLAFQRRNLTNPIEVARDGQEALDWLVRWENGEPAPAVILLDLKLPIFTGLEVLEKIKTHKTFHTIPVVVLTSSREDRDIQAAYALGANSYIVKPVKFEKFLDVATQIDLYWCVFNEPPV